MVIIKTVNTFDNPRVCTIGIVNLGIENTLATKPCIIDKIILFVAYP